MTFEHQTQMTNLLTRLGWEARIGAPRLDARVDEVVRYMRFLDEAPLQGPIKGVSTFSRTFAARGPRIVVAGRCGISIYSGGCFDIR